MQDAPALQQSSLYAAALSRLGAGCLWHAVPGGRLLLLMRRLPALGPVALLSRPTIALPADLRRALGARALIVNTETAAQASTLSRAGFLRLAAPRGLASLALDGTPEDWLARMDGKWRNRLRHAMRQGLEVRSAPLPPDPHHWLFHREAAQQHAQGYRNLPPALIVAIAAAEPGALTLFTARASGRIIAAMLFARHESAASYMIGWSEAAGRATSAHNLLLWQAMGVLRTAGLERIELGPCDANKAPGLARFKLGSGAKARSLGGTWAEVGALAPLHAGLRGMRRPTAPIPGTGPRNPAAHQCTDRAECS